jgi:hypothetical protein
MASSDLGYMKTAGDNILICIHGKVIGLVNNILVFVKECKGEAKQKCFSEINLSLRSGRK